MNKLLFSWVISGYIFLVQYLKKGTYKKTMTQTLIRDTTSKNSRYFIFLYYTIMP